MPSRHAPAVYDCPFCAVVRGEDRLPWTVQEDVVLRALRTTAWINARWWANNPGGVIVVPNEHVENMYELHRELAGDVHETARLVALALKASYGCDGVSTRQHNEPAGGQDVWHYHQHVFPRYRRDHLYLHRRRRTKPEERLPYAAKLRQFLADVDRA